MPDSHLRTNGRFHSDWLGMMCPRLKLTRNLLRNDGAISIAFDEGELASELLGEAHFIAELVWAAGRKNDSRPISVSHEYMVCYAKNAGHLTEEGITWRQRKKGPEETYAQHRRLVRNMVTTTRRPAVI